MILRSYSTLVESSERNLMVAITSLPNATVDAGQVPMLVEDMAGGRWAPLVWNGSNSSADGSLEPMRRIIRAVVAVSQTPQRFRNYDAADLMGSLLLQDARGQVETPHDALVDHVLATPIVPIEASWPSLQAVSTLVLSGSGALSLGLAIGPVGVAVGAVSGAFGSLLFQGLNTAADSYSEEVGRALGKRHGRRLDDPLATAAAVRDLRLSDLARAKESGEISSSLYEDLVADVWRESLKDIP